MAHSYFPRSDGAVLLDKRIYHHVGDQPKLIVHPDDASTPANARKIVFEVESGDFRFRPGDYRGIDFTDSDVTFENGIFITKANHGFGTGAGQYQLTNSGGTLPAGLNVKVDYFVIRIDDNKFALAASLEDALAGTRVQIISAAGGGTHNIGGPAGWAPNPIPQFSVSDGYGSSTLGSGGVLILQPSEVMTIVGSSPTDALTYWFQS